MNNQPPQQPMQIRATDADLKGFYSNVMMASHTQEEFMLDFFGLYNGNGILGARVITSPGHLKRMIAALQENLKNYETQFGPVAAAEAPAQDFGFQTGKQ